MPHEPSRDTRAHAVRTALRAATAGAHERVDALFSRFDLGERGGYVRFLAAQAGAHLPLEQALEDRAARLLPDWPQRRRAGLLRADLAALGVAPPVGEPVEPIGDDAAALGTLYVLEGSRLGGAMLRRSVPADLPSSFLAPAAPGLWRSLLDELERALTTPAARDAAIEAADAAFDAFERSARTTLEPA